MRVRLSQNFLCYLSLSVIIYGILENYRFKIYSYTLKRSLLIVICFRGVRCSFIMKIQYIKV